MTLTLSQLADKISFIVENLPVAHEVPNYWTQRLQKHFGVDPSTLPQFKSRYHSFEHPCVQLAMDEYLKEPGRLFELVGIKVHREHSLTDLLGFKLSSSPEEGSPVKYVRINIGVDRFIECVERGLYLITDQGNPLAVCMVTGFDGAIKVEAVSSEPSIAEQFLSDIDKRVKYQNIYKGEILSVTSLVDEVHIEFNKVEAVPKEAVIFPAGLLEIVEQHTVRFSQHRKLILSAGFSLKRGLLLYGAPGTGKTTLIKHLLGEMKDRTTLLVHGNGARHIKEVCKLARSVEPATVVIEDVDLIAKERSASSDERLLVELMNEMDGLASDADVLFVLTTNRPEVLEPALSARPGRIDQSIKIPLPDEDCRRRLIGLYAQGCNLEVENMSYFIKKTRGASAAFIRELVRKALLFAAQETGDRSIRDLHLNLALMQLLGSGSKLNRNILGFQVNESSAGEEG